jgi:hypothetical protein
LLFFAGGLPPPPAYPGYVVLPKENGKYLYLIMCLIWRFIVMKNKTMKYSSRMGQKTGMSNMLKKVIRKDVSTALMHECQNLNSGSRRANGLRIQYGAGG